jgi:hypothetical protein
MIRRVVSFVAMLVSYLLGYVLLCFSLSNFKVSGIALAVICWAYIIAALALSARELFRKDYLFGKKQQPQTAEK